jgi:hypothetical protein
MGASVDHLSADCVIRTLVSFTDDAGQSIPAGTEGRILRIHYDRLTQKLIIELEEKESSPGLMIHLHPPLRPSDPSYGDAPRHGNLRNYFAVTGADYGPPPKPKTPIYQAPVEPAPIPRPTASERLTAEERSFKDRIPSAHYALAIAEMYRARWANLSAEGKSDEAEIARQKASDWAYSFASMATSGGEGTAFSYERNQFLKSLGLEPHPSSTDVRFGRLPQ